MGESHAKRRPCMPSVFFTFIAYCLYNGTFAGAVRSLSVSADHEHP